MPLFKSAQALLIYIWLAICHQIGKYVSETDQDVICVPYYSKKNIYIQFKKQPKNDFL